MPITVNHIYTSPIADGTNTQLVRPSNWNSAHNVSVSLASNEAIKYISAGTNSVSSGTVNFSNSNNVSFGMETNGVVTATATLHASKVSVFGNHTADADVQHMINEGLWAGWIKGGTVSTAAGSTFTVGSGEGWFRTANTPTARLEYCSWNTATGSVPSNAVRYVFADYSAGTPTVSIGTAQTTSPHMQVYLAEVHNEAGLEVHEDPRPAGDLGRRIIDWTSDLFGTRVVTGEVVTDPSAPSRKVKVTAGSFWDRHFINYTDSTVDTSVAGTFTSVYRNGAGNWTRTASQTQWDNAFFDPGTGTLQAMSAGYYSNAWVIRAFTGAIYVQYDWAEYSSIELALAATSPTDRPEELHEHGFYVAQITFQKSATSPEQITDIRPIVGGGSAQSAADGFNILAAGTQTAGTAATVLFSNSNGISFGMSNSSVITASYTVPTQTNQTLSFAVTGNTTGNASAMTVDARSFTVQGLGVASVGFSTSAGGSSIIVSVPSVGGAGAAFKGSGTYTQNTGTIEFANSNGITFGLSNNGTMTASHNGLTQQSTQPVAYSATNGSANFSTLIFANSNGVSFSTGTQGLYATVQTNYLVTAAQSDHSHGNPTLALTNISGTTASASNGFTLSLSVGAGGANDGYNSAQFTNSTANSTMPILWAGNSNGSGNLTMGLTGSTVTASFSNPGATVFSNSNNVSFGLNGSTVTATATFAQTNQTLSFAMTGNTTGNASAMTVDARSLTIQGLGVASVGLSTSAGGSSILISVAGAGADGYNSAQFTNSTANSTMPIVWAGNSNGSGNLTFGLTGSTVTGSAPSGGGGVTLSGYQPFPTVEHINTQQGQSILNLRPIELPQAVQFDRVVFPIVFTAATNSTGSATIMMGMGIYTKNASTLSLAYSMSTTQGITYSGTVNSSVNFGNRNLTMGWTTTIPAGNYVVGIVSTTATGGANATFSNCVGTLYGSNYSGILGEASNITKQKTLGYGAYQATTALPNSIGFTTIVGVNLSNMRQQLYHFTSGTV